MEVVARRVLGALRFLDGVSGLPVTAPLAVSAPGVAWIRNRRSLYVVASAPGLEAHTAAFQAPPAAPAPGSVGIEFTVADPAGIYLPRRGTLRLPRDPDPAHLDHDDSLFLPQDVPIYPAPAAPVEPGWAVVYASVAGAPPAAGLAGALIRVVETHGNRVVGRGQTDGRGEALVAVQGIPVTTFGQGGGPVLSTEVVVRLQVLWDAAAPQPPDPDALESAHGAHPLRTTNATLASGRVLAISI